VLRDEEALRDLVRPQVLVEEEENLYLARRERVRDLVGNAGQTTAFANAIEKPTRNAARKRCLTPGDASEERGDLLRWLGLQEVAGRTGTDGREQARLVVGRREDDHLARRRLLPDPRQRGQTVHLRHREVEEHEIRLQRFGLCDRLRAVVGIADDVESLLGQERREGVPRQRVVVDDEDSLRHDPLIGTTRSADKGIVDMVRAGSYRSWLLGEILLVGLLVTGTALFALSESLPSAYELHDVRLSFDTAVAVVSTIVCVLASVRFLVEGRTLDLLVAAGFWSIALGTVFFGLVPVFAGGSLTPQAAWALVGARLLGAGLIAIAPYVDGRLAARRPSLVVVGAGVAVVLAGAAGVLLGPGSTTDTLDPDALEGTYVRIAAMLLAGLWSVAVLGFGLRYRRYGRDLDSWMCLAATLAFFADVSLVLTPVVSSDYLLLGDFLRVIAYGILLVGVWRAISDAEFGRAVADERARVAREIHDGLAQYLFAISTQVSMLESGAPLEQVLPRLKQAATSAQQEARFAVLALSSAGGSARFDAALRRYVELLTADGELEVELAVDPQVRLAPDEQIEVFRIVQEGLGNARRHSGAGHVEVSISQLGNRRVVSVTDNGIGFDEAAAASGQGVANMRLRAQAIDGQLRLKSAPGRGTAIEVVLRAA
jgi:signal transduction histidine kinase